MTALRELATSAGLDPEYRSWRGEPAAASDEAVSRALRALAPDLGVAFHAPSDAPAALAALESARSAEVVPPVVLGWDGELVVPFSVQAQRDGRWEVEVATESGRTVRAHGTLFELPADDHAGPGGAGHCSRRARIALGSDL